MPFPLKTINIIILLRNTHRYPIERIESVLLHWKKKRFSNLLGSSILHVKSVIFEPAYLAGAQRMVSTKKFCADQDPVELTTEVKYKFWIACGF
jgi:hypothetical protein